MLLRRATSFFALPLAVLLTGCSWGSDISDAVSSTFDSADSTVSSTLGLGSGTPAASAEALGLAVGDEPFAVKTGTAILGEGGSAADAVTAMFFAMTATYPVAAGLGGGGICLVADPVKGVEEFDFLPRAAKGGGAFAVPGAVRGFYDLQASFGQLPWQRDVSEGEAYAASGFPISHALSVRLTNAQNIVRLDAALASEFLDEGGNPKPEGAVTQNLALSQSLATVRLSGADGFYKGAAADEVIRYSAGQGGAISAADLSGYRTMIVAPRQINQGALRVALPAQSTGAGAFAASLLANAERGGNPESAVIAAVRQEVWPVSASARCPPIWAAPALPPWIRTARRRSAASP